jgi:ankyrin repeat protein
MAELSALSKAVVRDDLEEVRTLIRAGHTVLWEPFPFDETALHVAADSGNIPIIAELLDAGGERYIKPSQISNPAQHCGSKGACGGGTSAHSQRGRRQWP